MKKHFATILVFCGMSVFVSAQGTFTIDSGLNGGNGSGPGATTGGLVWIGNGVGPPVLDTTEDINLGLLWGTSSASVNTALNIDPFNLNTGVYAGCGNWIASQATGSGDISAYGTGALLDPNGNSYVVPGEAAGTTIWLVLQGWTGPSATYGGVILTGPNAGVPGQTAPFAVTLAVNTSPVQPDVHAMGALDMVLIGPEPSMLALSGVAAAAMLLVRRRKK